MKDLYQRKQPVLSFEIFPSSKVQPVSKTYEVLDELATLQPDYISVTYGAGGTNADEAIAVNSYIQNTLGIPTLAHLTCIRYTREELLTICQELKENHINHVLSLRGDRPLNMSDEDYAKREFHYATQMVQVLREHTDLTIAGAAYPEKHFEAPSFSADLNHLKEKVDAGLSFLITQLFFDNELFYRFLEEARKLGITIPISCGIMPITSTKQLSHTISLSGSSVPKSLSDLIAKYGENPDDMRKAGCEFATKQMNDLITHGVDGIHLYTMNRSKTTAEIVRNLSLDSM
ncbi:MAG: methylenetetrahydrofolate reductase [NAD(P)H] [Eubacteriales bacterium]